MIGLRIKTYLDEHGIRYAFLAEKLHITPSVMTDLLKGKRKIDCVEYYKICEILGVNLEFFFEQEKAEV
jgi:transcriptional regulator with XRE-family HTH domain